MVLSAFPAQSNMAEVLALLRPTHTLPHTETQSCSTLPSSKPQHAAQKPRENNCSPESISVHASSMAHGQQLPF